MSAYMDKESKDIKRGYETATTLDGQIDMAWRRAAKAESATILLAEKVDTLQKQVAYLMRHSRYADHRRQGRDHYDAIADVQLEFNITDEQMEQGMEI